MPLGSADALAAKASIEADAAALRDGGVEGSLRYLRVLAFLDRLNGRDPLDRITATRDDPAGAASPPSAATHPGGPAPLPALINLIVPAGTLFGWSGVPAEAGGWGLLDRDDARDIVQAASMHPRTRWCVRLTGPAVINGSGSWEPYSCRSFPCCD